MAATLTLKPADALIRGFLLDDGILEAPRAMGMRRFHQESYLAVRLG